MNQVNIVGRLCDYVKTYKTRDGVKTAYFKIAALSVSGKNKTRMDYILCRAWGEMADYIRENFFRKSLVAVSGNLRTDSWYKDGKLNFVTFVAVKNISAASDLYNADNEYCKSDLSEFPQLG